MPKESGDLWTALIGLHDAQETEALFAHCASLTINVVTQAHDPRKSALAHGDELARAVHLDMCAAGWRPTAENYLGRVPKARILEAVREAKGDSGGAIDGASEEGGHGAGSRAHARRHGLASRDFCACRSTSISRAGDPMPTRPETDELPAFLAGDAAEAAELGPDEPDATRPQRFAVAAE